MQFTAESTVTHVAMDLDLDLAQSHNTELSVRQLSLFSSIITCLREHISWHQDHMAVENAPWVLPLPVANFCADVLAVRSDTIKDAWEALRDTLWRSEGSDSLEETSPLVRDGHLLNVFLTHGIKYKIGALHNDCSHFTLLM